MSEAEIILDQLIDNIRRTDLRASEEALSFQRLMDLNSWSTRELARQLSTTVDRVASTVRLLRLPPDVLETLERGYFPPESRRPGE